MTVLRNDGLSRRPRREPRSSRHHGLVLFFALVFASIALLALSRADNGAITWLRRRTAETLAPALEIASGQAARIRQARQQIGTYFDLFDELERLKQENQQLRQWQTRATELESDLEHYRDLLNGVKDSPFRFVTGRVIAEGRGPFARSCLINAGSLQGIRDGYAVVNGDGLVGRVLDSGERASRVLLVTDLNSRVPVSIGPAHIRGVLIGDNTDLPRLAFLPGGAVIAEGLEVSTSGQDGVLPRGIRIGTVVRAGRGYAVKLHADLSRLEFVSALFADTPMLDLVERSGVSNRILSAGR